MLRLNVFIHAAVCAELEAYAGVISALRAQGELTKDKKELLGELTRVLRYLPLKLRRTLVCRLNDSCLLNCCLLFQYLNRTSSS